MSNDLIFVIYLLLSSQELEAINHQIALLELSMRQGSSVEAAQQQIDTLKKRAVAIRREKINRFYFF